MAINSCTAVIVIHCHDWQTAIAGRTKWRAAVGTMAGGLAIGGRVASVIDNVGVDWQVGELTWMYCLEGRAISHPSLAAADRLQAIIAITCPQNFPIAARYATG